MNLPNQLTLARCVLAGVFVALMSFPSALTLAAAYLVFTVAAITDHYDGKLARRYGMVSNFGKLMDPLADKVLVCAALVSFVGVRLKFEPNYSLVPAWVVVVIIAREFAVTGLRLLAAATDQKRIISAGSWGKWKTAWQMTAIIATFILLAVREDLMPYLHMSKTFLRQYDAAFVITSWVLSTLVVLVTVISGWKYFADHWDLVTAEM